MDLTLVVPRYNEAARLPATLAAARRHLDASAELYEVIVVDDGSADQIVAEAGTTGTPRG